MEVIVRCLPSVERTQFVSQQVDETLPLLTMLLWFNQLGDVKKKAYEKFALLQYFRLKRSQYSDALLDYWKLSALGIRNEEVQV